MQSPLETRTSKCWSASIMHPSLIEGNFLKPFPFLRFSSKTILWFILDISHYWLSGLMNMLEAMQCLCSHPLCPHPSFYRVTSPPPPLTYQLFASSQTSPYRVRRERRTAMKNEEKGGGAFREWRWFSLQQFIGIPVTISELCRNLAELPF